MLRLGQIDYLNTQPLYSTLDRHLRGPVRVVRGVPTALNRALMADEVDLAPISAIEAARHADQVVVLPDLAIASLGAVRTVLLFSWRPDPRELDGRVIAVSDHSATSVALLDVLCRERYAISAELRPMPQDLEHMLAVAEAALLIGDAALVEAVRHRAFPRPALGPNAIARPYIFDLGDEWLKMTGLPFVFALWSARRDRLEAVQAAGAPHALLAARAEGIAAIPDIARAYAPRLGLEPGTCATYLRDLRYTLGPDEIEGLTTFCAWHCPNSSRPAYTLPGPLSGDRLNSPEV
ncbi:MAG: menaquinone biosynthesis protein [Ardenticatenia bacterium]|nr:menaquinone biosynthesis protein [Ardenticatenia bacterium]